MNRSVSRLKSALTRLLGTKRDVPELFPGLLGTIISGQKVVFVPGRQDHVFVRLHGNTAELVKAFNDQVPPTYNMPVLLIRDEVTPSQYRVLGRDVEVYSRPGWGSTSAVQKHGQTHSRGNPSQTGADMVWVYKNQIVPLMLRPANVTGTMSGYVEPDWYEWQGSVAYWPGGLTVDFTPAKPTGGNDGRYVTVALDGETGALYYITGQYFNVIVTYIPFEGQVPMPDPNDGIPIGAVFLVTGTRTVTWSNLVDTRVLVRTMGRTLTDNLKSRMWMGL